MRMQGKWLAGLVLLTIGGCGGGQGGFSPNALPGLPFSSPRQSDGLELSVVASKLSYAPGEKVPLTLAVKNVTSQPITLVNSGGPLYQIRIARQGGVFWAFPPLGPGHPASRSLTVSPGQTATLAATWDQTMAANTYVPGGAYTVSAALLPDTINGIRLPPGTAPDLSTNPLQITIIAPCPNDPIAVPREVIVGIQPSADNASLPAKLAPFGMILNRDTDIHFALLQLRQDVCIADAISALQKLPFVVSAEPNGYGEAAGG